MDGVHLEAHLNGGSNCFCVLKGTRSPPAVLLVFLPNVWDYFENSPGPSRHWCGSHLDVCCEQRCPEMRFWVEPTLQCSLCRVPPGHWHRAHVPGHRCWPPPEASWDQWACHLTQWHVTPIQNLVTNLNVLKKQWRFSDLNFIQDHM